MRITKDFVTSVRRAGNFFARIDLLRNIVRYDPITPTKEFTKTVLNDASTYRSIYLTGLRYLDYNLILEDYSYFQFSITAIDKMELRYGFYPNPFIEEKDMPLIEQLEHELEEGEINFEDYSQLLSEFEFNPKIPLIRYEVNYSRYQNLRHPTSVTV